MENYTPQALLARSAVMSRLGFFAVRLHVMQRTVFRTPFSVCLSVKRVHCDKTKENCAQILIPYQRTFIWFSDTKNGCWGRPLLRENFGQIDPVRAKRRFSIDISS